MEGENALAKEVKAVNEDKKSAAKTKTAKKAVKTEAMTKKKKRKLHQA